MLTKKNIQNTSLIPILFVLLLFLVLAILSCSIIAAGNNVYQKIVTDMNLNYQNRVALSYINTKVRQSEGQAQIEQSGDVTSLQIKQTYDNTEYTTYIYYYEGGIRELFIASGDQFAPSDGIEVVKVADFTITPDPKNQRIMTACVTDDGGNVSKMEIAARTY